jgi:hypothetical protein
MLLLKRLPARRFEILIGLLAAASVFGLARIAQLNHMGGIVYWFALFSLEWVLPVGAGLSAAGLLAGDPALDILLSAHRPAYQVLRERLLLVTGIAFMLGSAALPLASAWKIAIPHSGSDRFFIWLSPLVFCTGLACSVSLVRGRALDGVLATLLVMGGSLLSLTAIPRWCMNLLPEKGCAWWLISPIMTLGSPGDPLWPLNRLLWLALGASLIGLSLRLARREEPLLQDVTMEEG